MSSENTNNFERAMWMLESMSVDDLIGFWKLFGPCRLGPNVERCDPWWKDLNCI